MDVNKICKMCSTEFQTKVKNKLYCSTKCSNKMSAINRTKRKKDKHIVKENVIEIKDNCNVNQIEKLNSIVSNQAKQITDLTRKLDNHRFVTIKEVCQLLQVTPITAKKILLEHNIKIINLNSRMLRITQLDYLSLSNALKQRVSINKIQAML